MVPENLLSPTHGKRRSIAIPPGSFMPRRDGRMSPEFLDMSARRASIMAIAPGAFIPTELDDSSTESLPFTPISPGKRRSIVAITPGTEAQVEALSPELMESSAKQGSIVAITPGKYREFFDPSKEATAARKTYFKILISGIVLIVFVIFAIFSLFWGALWKIPAKALPGIIVDFDGGDIGANFTQFLTQAAPSKIAWRIVSASDYPGGTSAVGHAVLEEKAWAAITVNAGSSARLSASLASPNATYDGTTVLTVFGVEGRNENAFRNLISPMSKALLDAFSVAMAKQVAKGTANIPSDQLTSLLTNSPQTVVQPVSYVIDNLAPFNPPVASAVTFVGLILVLILSFFLVMNAAGARDAARLDRTLTTKSLIIVRFVTSFVSYFVVTFFYCMLSMAFQLPVTRKFGHSGFLVFWALNYVGMLSVGLAIESLVALLTPKFIPFFMLVWIITNVSVSIWPIEVLPWLYRYGYAVPFYNLSRATRTLIFSTKNRVGFEFGILFIWVAISCVTLPLIQIFVRRKFHPVDVTELTIVAPSEPPPQPKWKEEADQERYNAL